MPITKFGRELKEAQDTNRQLSRDLSKIGSVDGPMLTSLVKKVSTTYPCNIWEMAVIEAKESGADHTDLFDVVSGLIYISENSENESPKDVVADLLEQKVIQEKDSSVVLSALSLAESLRETGKIVSAYKTLGPPLLWDVSGTVDLRCRFHTSSADFNLAKEPQEIVDVSPVVIATMHLRERGETKLVTFQMDEHDLSTLGRFVSNMNRELTLASRLIPTGKTEVSRG
jgi:hypothetical protein